MTLTLIIVANRILCVGDYGRCERLSKNLTHMKKTESKRGFLTYTGLYKDKPISISCAGMGVPNTDLLIREAREVITGPMVMARFGTCGVVDPTITPGNIIIPTHSILIQQNYDYDPKKDKPEDQFYISKECAANVELHKLLVTTVGKEMDEKVVHKGGTMGTTETFYSGQGRGLLLFVGRKLEKFNDSSESLLKILKAKYPKHDSLEMEMYTL